MCNLNLHPSKKILFGAVLLLFLLHARSYAQQCAVSGTVRDRAGKALSDVSVSEKGREGGAKTDDDGGFRLSVQSGQPTLVFSFVGYFRREVAVASGTETVDVMLEEDATGLDEVVIVGYQDIQRRKTTGAIATVNGKDFENTPYATFDAMLQGRVAGLMAQDATDPSAYLNNSVLTGWNAENLVRQVSASAHREKSVGNGLEFEPFLQIQRHGTRFYLRSSVDGKNWNNLPGSPFLRSEWIGKTLRVGIYQTANSSPQKGHGLFEDFVIWK